MEKVAIPQYVDPHFFDSCWRLIDDEEFKSNLSVQPCAEALKRLIFDEGMTSAWKQLEKEKKNFIKRLQKEREVIIKGLNEPVYDGEFYQHYYELRADYPVGDNEYVWVENDKVKYGVPVEGSFCDIESKTSEYELEDLGEPESAYVNKIISPLFIACIGGLSLVTEPETVKPAGLVKKAKRLDAAVNEMRESLRELGGTPQFKNYYRSVTYREKHRAFSSLRGENKIGFQEWLDLWEAVAGSYLGTLEGRTNAGFSKKPYAVRLILKVFFDTFGGGLYGTTAKFVTALMGERVSKEYVADIARKTDFEEFVSHLNYPSLELTVLENFTGGGKTLKSKDGFADR